MALIRADWRPYLIGYQVLDENGDRLGVASGYIINACETDIIYILMEPEASLNLAPGSRAVIPFEAVTMFFRGSDSRQSQ